MRKNIMIFHLKINIFAGVKYCCILHGLVCVMFVTHSLIEMFSNKRKRLFAAAFIDL